MSSFSILHIESNIKTNLDNTDTQLNCAKLSAKTPVILHIESNIKTNLDNTDTQLDCAILSAKTPVILHIESNIKTNLDNTDTQLDCAKLSAKTPVINPSRTALIFLLQVKCLALRCSPAELQQ